jgi:hypothetical protein
MSIDRNAFILPKSVPQHDVGRLSSDPRQNSERFHFGWDLSGMILHERLGHADEALGLVSKEPGRPDQFFHLSRVCLRQVMRRWKAAEERRSHQIDSDIGALRGENRRHQQLEWGAIREFALRRGVLSLESGENLPDGRPRCRHEGRRIRA